MILFVLPYIIFHRLGVGDMAKSIDQVQPQRQTLAGRSTTLARGGTRAIRSRDRGHAGAVWSVPSGRESHADLLAAVGRRTATDIGTGKVPAGDELRQDGAIHDGTGAVDGGVAGGGTKRDGVEGDSVAVSVPPGASPVSPAISHRPLGASFEAPDLSENVEGIADAVDPRRQQCGCDAAALDRNLLVVLSKPWRYFSSAHWFHICEYYLPHQSRQVPLLSHTKSNATVYIQVRIGRNGSDTP